MSEGDLGKKLSTARGEKGWSQTRLAAVSGVSQQHISALETGTYKANDDLLNIATALGKCVGDLDDRYKCDGDEKAVGDPLTRAADALELIALYLGTISDALEKEESSPVPRMDALRRRLSGATASRPTQPTPR